MAERASTKGKRTPRHVGAAQGGMSQGGGAGAPPTLAELAQQANRIKTLERENTRLTAQLEEARERIARLEQSRTEAVNRIDWAIDSLHNILEKGA
jgi:chromosome segregation ATPase